MIRFLMNRRRDRRRQIFRCRIAGRIIAVDPIAATLALHRHAKYLPRHLDDAIKGNRSAQQIATEAACDVFGVRSMQDDERRGLTMQELLELLVRFDAYRSGIRQRYESLADSVSLFGGDVISLRRSNYEEYVGLWLNRHRAQVRVAEFARLGISGAFGQRHIGWFRATSESEDEATMAYDEHVAAQAAAQAQ